MRSLALLAVAAAAVACAGSSPTGPTPHHEMAARESLAAPGDSVMYRCYEDVNGYLICVRRPLY